MYHIEKISDHLRSFQFIGSYEKGFSLQCFDAVGWAAGRASGL